MFDRLFDPLEAQEGTVSAKVRCKRVPRIESKGESMCHASHLTNDSRRYVEGVFLQQDQVKFVRVMIDYDSP